MGKTAFVFPGQGAQYPGMGKDFYETDQECREIFDMASDICGFDMPKICFTENDQLNITEYTQAAMLTVSLAMLHKIQKAGISSQVNAGLSLGEYGALAASGVLTAKDALKVVRQRGIFMQEAVPSGGAMTAVLGLDADVIAKVCEETEGIVEIANYNCPGQIVISGEEAAVAKAAEQLKESGARRCVPLNVSGPFHSSMLKGAGEKLKDVLTNVEIQDFTTPYVANVTGEYVTDKERVKPLLVQQVSSSVRWIQSVENMINQGVDTFLEIGPGRTLSSFIKKIDRSVTVMNIEKAEDLEKVLEGLKEN